MAAGSMLDLLQGAFVVSALPVAVAVLVPGFSHWTEHGSGDRSPEGKHQRQQNQQPDTK